MGASDILRRVSFFLFPTARRVYVWRQTREAYNPDCLLPTVKHGSRLVIVWIAISWISLGFIVNLHGKINNKDYLNIWEIMFIHWFRHFSLMVIASSKTIMLQHIPLMWFRIGMKSMNTWSGHQNVQISILLSICGTFRSNKLETVTLRCRACKN